MKEKVKVYLLTEEELERFDQLLTALGQAYWSIVHQRSINVPNIKMTEKKITKKEEEFYQLHLDLNNEIDQDLHLKI